jgi:toxin CcdB
MAQFDLHRNRKAGAFPLLLDVQADLLASLATRVVVPLMTARRHRARPITRLNPVVRVKGVEHVLLFQEMAAIPATALGEIVASLADRRAEMIGAIDLLLAGI